MKYYVILQLSAFLAAISSPANAEAPVMRLTSPSEGNKPPLTIPIAMNYGGFPAPLGPLCSEGIKIAIDAADKRLEIASRYKISFDLYDEQCDYSVGVSTVASILESSLAGTGSNNTVPLIAGPLCADTAFTGMMVKHYNFVEISDLPNVVETIVDRQKYNSFFSIGASLEVFFEAIPAFLESNGWSRVFLLSETFPFWSPLEDVLLYNLAKKNITLAGTAKVPIPPDMMPTSEHFGMAVEELSRMNPRIIILDTSYGSLLACYLHRYKLFGPSFVYLVPGWGFFSPNAFLRAEGCTPQMLFEVVQSVIYYHYASPISMFEDQVDELGINKATFESELIRRVGGRPQLDSKWFFWRGTCYNQAAQSLVVLDRVDSKLRQTGDTLLNWVTEREAFKNNGSYISSLFRSTIEGMVFKGLTTNTNERPNGRKGGTGFYQVQSSVSEADLGKVKEEDLSAIIKIVPIATYDSAKQNAAIKWGPGTLIWKGRNGQAPYDSLRILPVKEPLLGKTANGILAAFACLLLVANFIFFVANLWKRNSDNISKSLPPLNGLVLVGNVLITLFVVVMPVEGRDTSHINCMAATLLLVPGFSLVVTPIVAKMQIGYVVASMFRKTYSCHPNGTQIGTHMSQLAGTKHNSAGTQHAGTRQRTNQTAMTGGSKTWAPVPVIISSAHCSAEMSLLLKRNSKLSFIFALIWAGINLFLVAIWFGLEPFETVRFDRNLEFSTSDLSLAFQHSTMSCGYPTSSISIGFICTVVVMYGIVLLRSFYLEFALRKVSIEDINDLNFVRTASYSVAILVAASAAVIAGFFKDGDPGTLQIAVSIAALLVVALTTLVIFIPKLKKGFFYG